MKGNMFFKQYLIALVTFIALDIPWIGLVAKNFYSQQIGFLMKSNLNWIAAIGFYLLYIAGLIVFVISPSFEKQSLVHAVLFGALFGLVAYATYDLTNLATVKNWPVMVTIVDLLWGASVSALVSALTVFISMKIRV
jgi:uncharacterized membrane protein